MGINSSSDNKEETKDEKLSLLERMKKNRRTKAEVRDANVTCSRGIKKIPDVEWQVFSACGPQELSLVAQ